jgi:hypothetical protein
MTKQNTQLPPTLLTRLQNWWQYLLFGWFLAVSVLIAVGGTLAPKLALVGIGLLLTAIMTSLVALAAEFFKAGKRRYAWACGVLLAILILTVVIRLVMAR